MLPGPLDGGWSKAAEVWRLVKSSRAGSLAPGAEGVIAGGTAPIGGQAPPAVPEAVADAAVSGPEALGMAG